jgi:hypothetical protein
MRVVSSSEVIESAERVAQKILDTYSEPDKSFGELRGMVKDHAIDLLHDFSQTCRMEQTLPSVGSASMRVQFH